MLTPGIEASLTLIELGLPVTLSLTQHMENKNLKLTLDADGSLEGAFREGSMRSAGDEFAGDREHTRRFCGPRQPQPAEETEDAVGCKKCMPPMGVLHL